MSTDRPDPDLSFALSGWGEPAKHLANTYDRHADHLGTSIKDFMAAAKSQRVDTSLEHIDVGRTGYRGVGTGYATIAEAYAQVNAIAERYRASGIPLADLHAVIDDEERARVAMMQMDTGASEIAYREAQKKTADTRARRDAMLDALYAAAARVGGWFTAEANAVTSSAAEYAATVGGRIGGSDGDGGWDTHTYGGTDRGTTGTQTPDPHTPTPSADGPGTSDKPTVPSPERYPTGVDTTDLTPAPGAGPGDPTQDRYGPITLDDLTPLPYPSTSATPLQVDQTPAPTGQMYPGGKVPTSLPSDPQSTGDPTADLAGADTSPVIAAGAVPGPAAATVPGPAGAIPPTAAATSAPLSPLPAAPAAARGPVAHLSTASGVTNATSTAGASPASARSPYGAGLPGMPPVMPAGTGGGSGARSGDKAPIEQSAESAEMSGINALNDAVRGGTILRGDDELPGGAR